jgi:hypothetical protein
VVIVSKTFTIQETMLNVKTMKSWLIALVGKVQFSWIDFNTIVISDCKRFQHNPYSTPCMIRYQNNNLTCIK